MQCIKVVIYGICVLFWNNIFAQSKALDSLKKGIETHIQRDSIRINYLIGIGRYIIRTEKQKAIQYANEAVDIAEELKKTPIQIKAYIHLGKMYNMQNRYIGAINYYQKAMVLCEQTQDTINLAEIYFGLATIYRYQERYEKAEQYNNRALTILNHAKYDGLRAKIYNNMGILYDGQKNYGKAIEYYEKSLDIKKKTKDTLGMPITLSNLAIIYSYDGKFKDGNYLGIPTLFFWRVLHCVQVGLFAASPHLLRKLRAFRFYPSRRYACVRVVCIKEVFFTPFYPWAGGWVNPKTPQKTLLLR